MWKMHRLFLSSVTGVVLPAAIALSLSLISCTTSKRISSYDSIEESARLAAPIDVNAYLEKYAGYPGVCLDYVFITEHSGSKGSWSFTSWSIHQDLKQRYIIIDTASTSLTTLSFNSRPKWMDIYVTDPDGTVTHWYETELIKKKDSVGDEVYILPLPDVRPGTIVNMACEWGGSELYFPTQVANNVLLRSAMPYEHLKVGFAYPDWWDVQVKKLGPNRSLQYRVDKYPERHKLMMVYEATDVPALHREPYSPYPRDMADYFQYMVIDQRMQGTDHDWSTTWRDIADQYHDKVLKNARDRYPSVDSLVERLPDLGAPEAGTRAAAIVAWVRRQIDTDGPHRDGDIDKVLKTGSGNWIDACELTRAMCEAVGLRADLALLHAADQGTFDTTYISQEQFNRMAVLVADSGITYAVFPYDDLFPCDIIPPRFRGQPALIVSGEKCGSITNIPDTNLTQNGMTQVYDLSIGRDGLMTVRETITMLGTEAYRTRMAIRGKSDADKAAHIRNLISFQSGDLTLDDYNVSGIEDYRNPLVLTLDFTVRNLVAVGPEQAVVPTGELLAPLSDGAEEVDPNNRHNDIYIDDQRSIRKQIILHYPDGWTLTGAPPDTTQSNVFGTATRKCAFQAGTIDIDQEVTLHRCREPRERIVDLAKLIGTHSVLDLPAIVFSIEPKS